MLLAKGNKILYKLIREAIMKCEKEIRIDNFTIQNINYLKILSSILNDSPFIFWASCKIQYSVDEKGTTIRLFYNDLYREKNKYLKRLLEISQNLFDSLITNCKTNYEVALKVHDFLSKVEYDNESKIIDDTEDYYFAKSHSLIGPLIYGKGVCEGIADAYNYLLSCYGIVSTTISGSLKKDNEPHAWNVVQLTEGWFHVDVTWDLSSSNNGKTSHLYFCVDDSFMRQKREYGYYIPCNSGSFLYFKNSGVYFNKNSDVNRYLRSFTGTDVEFYVNEEPNIKEIFNSINCSYQTDSSHWFRCVLNKANQKNSDSILNYLKKRNVTQLIHFTPIDNVNRILKEGIVPRINQNPPGKWTDEYRIENELDCNSISISFPNWKMMWKKIYENMKIVIIVLSVDLINDFSCSDLAFYPGNATKYPGSYNKHTGIDSLKLLFSNTILVDDYSSKGIKIWDTGTYDRAYLKIPTSFTTDPQAEILIRGTVNPRHIKKIIVQNNRMKQELERIINDSKKKIAIEVEKDDDYNYYTPSPVIKKWAQLNRKR